MATLHYPGTPGTMLYFGMAAPAGGTVITTLSLVNTSGSEQAAGFVSPMFGQPFKQGDIPAGEYPQFTLTDDTPCPATIWGVTSWPDGSMKFCGAMIRVPAAVAGSGSVTINVRGGGNAPAASARAVSDLTAANISTELVGVTNLTGTWAASLNTAITDADDIVLIGNGPAGAIWRIGGPFKQGGTAHGQLHAWHYVAALQNAAGALAGIRYLGRVAQPWADVATPTPTRRVFTASLKSGSSTLRSLQGHDTTETVGANISLPHYASIFTAGTDGRWDYVQGGGSQAAECTVRVVHNEVYFIASRLVPPYDTSVSPTSSTSVDYYPMGRGSMLRNMGTTSEREDIGILPSWAARHILTGASVDERVCRVNGLAASGWKQVARRSTTRQVIPVVDASATYTGLGTVQTTWRGPVSNISGFVSPSDTTSLWQSEYESSHRPGAVYYPYLVTGEPQYLDMLVEQANGLISNTAVGTSTWQVGTPVTGNSPLIGAWAGDRSPSIAGTTYKGAGVLFRGDLYRIQAWMMRDIAQAAAVYPDTCPSGTETRKYLREVIGNTYSAMIAYNNALPQSWRDSGLMSFTSNGSNDAAYESPWALGYMANSLCHQASIYPTSDGVTCRQHMAKFWSSINAIADIACVATYRMGQWKGDNTRVESASDLVFYRSETLTWAAATSRFTTSAAWNPTNGDVFAFSTKWSANKPFAEATDETRLYAVNVSGKTFQLATTPGGSPLTISADSSVPGFMCRLQDAGTLFSFQGVASPSSYVSNIYGAIRHHLACGDTVVASARTAQDANLTASGVTFTSDPKNAMATAYPGV